MPDGEIFEEPKKGLLERLARGLLPSRRAILAKGSVRRREVLDLVVPAEKAEVVRSAVERWLRSHEIGAAVTTEAAASGKVRVRARLDDTDASKLDFSAEDVQSELEDLLADSIG